MAGMVENTGSGFFHPYARSVTAQASARPLPQAPAASQDASVAAPARKDAIPTSGGFVNPSARSAKN